MLCGNSLCTNLRGLSLCTEKIVSLQKREGISLDCMNAVIAMAFSIEALINLVGKKRVKGWKERNSYEKKIEAVCSVAGHSFNKAIEPCSTLWKLKELRDSLAHEKSIEFNEEIKTREDLRERMKCEWDTCSTPDFVNHAWDKVKEFEHMLLEGAKISVGETLTGAVSLPKKTY